MLKLDAKTKGVLVLPPESPPANYPLKSMDVLVQIGDYEIDNEGWVNFEAGRRVPCYYLIPRLARDQLVLVTVLREGKRVKVSLPLARRENWLIREFDGEQPSYFIHGPLVFSPLYYDAIPAYAQLNPSLYDSNSPLMTRRNDRPRFPDEELVVVTAPMFAHKICKGYDVPVGQIVRDINGTKIKNLPHLVATLRDCTGDFVTIHFADEPGRVVVFDRNELNKATDDIMEENGIAPSRRGSPDMLKIWKKESSPPK